MVKRFFLGLISLCMPLCATAQQVAMHITDTQGKQLRQVALGQPFMVNVVVSGSHSAAGHPDIEHDRHVVFSNPATKTRIINSHVTQQFIYQAVIDPAAPPGEYTIGPAIITINGRDHRVEARTIVAGETTQLRSAAADDADGEGPSGIVLFVDKKHAVVGEKIRCTLRWYFDDPTVRFHNLTTSESAAFTMKEVQGPFEKQESRANGRRRYVEWWWDAYPRKAGSYAIPSYGVDYEVEGEMHHSPWGRFNFFFGNRFERKRTYSNAVTIAVDPLPGGLSPETFVGTIHSIDATLNPTIARRGEGVVLTIDIIGEGDLDGIEQFELRDMPDEIRYYESKKQTMMAKKEGEKSYRHIEFVLQGMEAGSWHIPAQHFSYFDVESRKRQTRMSTPLTLTIESAPLPVPAALPRKEVKDTSVGDDGDITGGPPPLWKDGPWHDVGRGMRLPWVLLMLLLAVPLSWSLYVYGRNYLSAYYARHAGWLHSFYAFRRAKGQFAQLQQGAQGVSVYQILLQCVAARMQKDPHTVSRDDLAATLSSRLDETRRDKWQAFLDRAAEQAFGGRKSATINALAKEGKEWLAVLERELR